MARVTKAEKVGGITHDSRWYLTANFTGTALDPVTLWAEVSGAQVAPLGASMVLAAGIFTFPAVGRWRVGLYTRVHSSNTSRANHGIIHGCVDYTTGPTWSTLAYGAAEVSDSPSTKYVGTVAVYTIDVQDLAEQKVKFSYTALASNTLRSGPSETYAIFTRIGDTP